MENALVSYVSYLGQLIWPQELAIFLSPSERRTASLASNLRLGPSHLDHGCGGKSCSTSTLSFGGLVLVSRNPRSRYRHSASREAGNGGPVHLLDTDRSLYRARLGDAGSQRSFSPPSEFYLRRHSLNIGLSYRCGVASGGNWRDSETVFRHALRVTRDNDTVHTFLAEVFIDEGRYEEAEAHCYEALRIEPKHSGAFFELGRVFEERGELERSRDFYLKALDISNDYFEALVGLATVLQKQGSLSGAIHLFRRALELKPDDPILYYNLGNAFEEREEWSEAIFHYNRRFFFNRSLRDPHQPGSAPGKVG